VRNCSRLKYGKCLSPVNPQPEENFSKHPMRKDGKRSHCKTCGKNESHLFRVKNPEYSRSWAENNQDKKKAAHQNYRYRKFKKNECELCRFMAVDMCQLDVDHIDGDHLNDDPLNLQTLCANCHRLKSRLAGDVGRPKLIKGGLKCQR
jgi:hypothetical protein